MTQDKPAELEPYRKSWPVCIATAILVFLSIVLLAWTVDCKTSS